ncbi:MAG: YihY/virulence factor BrkB family protein [Actinomycetota bacterium]|nr:YihY/virulence factor BrkB family protein [Actinomycetota bacterium]
MNPLERAIRQVDAFQQSHRVPGFVFSVVKKFGNDNAGSLAVQLTYALFTTIFPLLLLLETVLALVLSGQPSARHAVLHSAFGEFPIVGRELAKNIHVMRRNSAFGLAVGLLGLAYGATGLAGTGLYAMAQVWSIPGAVRPNYVSRMARSLLFLAVLGVGVLVTTFLASFGTFGKHDFWLGVAAEVAAGVVNVGLYAVAFRVLTPKQVGTRQLLPGAAFGGVTWTVLQAAGGYVVGHYLRDDNAVYGMFGIVLGLLAWLYIGSEVTIYAAELNTVIARRLWPRGMVQPPLTEADQRTVALQAIKNQRRPEQEVITRVRGRPMSQAEYLAAGRQLDPDLVGTERRVPDDRASPGSWEG